ncbi:MAG TPA: GGDEF domain-containing protein [Thermoleophilaceae bacterium]|nr:GGDEF domain-containing protein [Thermoleophilaceae bacterium]
MVSSGEGRLRAQLDRERLIDIDRRLARYRRAAFVVLALALLSSGPYVGWWWMAPLGGAAVGFAVADHFLVRSEHPARWAAAGWALSPVMIGVSVALTGAVDSPAVSWFALPAATLATRFERRGVIGGVAYICVLMLGSTLAVEPGAVVDNPPLLIAPLGLVIAVAILSGAVAGSDREHRREAVLDQLTGLLNRTALTQRLTELEQGAARNPNATPVGFLLCDLDHFKDINDRHGHRAGDTVLKDVAYALRNSLRTHDPVYRVGGEEFAVLLVGATQDTSADVAERLRAAALSCSRKEIPVTMSVGVAAVPALGHSAAFNFTALFEDADRALYEANQRGRNCVVTAGPTAHVAPEERESLLVAGSEGPRRI